MPKSRKKGTGKSKQLTQQLNAISSSASSESSITSIKQRRAKPGDAEKLITRFLEQEDLLSEESIEFDVELYKPNLFILIDLCKQFLPIRLSVEKMWKNQRRANSFSDCLQQALEITITRIGKAYVKQLLKKDATDFLLELKAKLETEIAEFSGISGVKETLYCELGCAYCNIDDYENALYTFEKINSPGVKKYIVPQQNVDILLYLRSLIPQDLLEENSINLTEVRITSERVQLESKKKENAVKIREIEDRLRQSIFKLIEKYAHYAIEVIQQEEAKDLLFLTNCALFFITAVDEKSDFSCVKQRFERALKTFPDENGLKELLEEQRGRLFFERARINQILGNYMHRLVEKDAEINDLIRVCRENWKNDLRISARLGFSQAQSYVSIFLEEDKSVARKLQQRAAAGGDIYACYNEAHDLIHEDNGLNDEQKKKVILFLLNRSAEAGHVPALYKLGEIYSGSLTPCLIEPDESKALEYFERAAEYNDPNAWRELGRVLFKRGRFEDIALALVLWQQAKSYNNIGAMLLLASSLSEYINYLIHTEKVQGDVYWQRMVVKYVAQNIMHCEDVIIQLHKWNKDNLDLNERDEQQRLLSQACAILYRLSKLLNEDIGFIQENRAVRILRNKIAAILENVSTIAEFQQPLASSFSDIDTVCLDETTAFGNEETNDLYFGFFHKVFSQFVDLPSTQENLAQIGVTQTLNSNPHLNTLFEIYPILQNLANTALTLYEISGIFWSAGSEHHRLFSQYKQDIRELFENLLDEIKQLSLNDLSPDVLSCLCKALLGLGRLRLNADDLLVKELAAAIIGKITEHMDSLSIENRIDIICALSFFSYEYSLGSKLLESLVVYLQNNSERLSFIEISRICHAISIIDANRAGSSQADSTAESCAAFIIKMNNAVIPLLSQSQPFVYLHQWVLAIDYFMHLNPELVASLQELPAFRHKYEHVYSSCKPGNPSHFQNRVKGYVNSIFENAVKEEVFFGLLAGDLFVSVPHIPARIGHMSSDLLFEVNGPTHFNCNSFQSDEAILLFTTRDIFHQFYKKLLHAAKKKDLYIISIPFTLVVDRKEEKEAIIKYINSQFRLAQPQSLSNFTAQTFLRPPRTIPSTKSYSHAGSPASIVFKA